MATADLKREAHRLVDELPDGATWDDLMYQIYVRQLLEAGIAASEAGRLTELAAVRARFGLPQ